MKICPKCGTPNADTYRFCKKCGNKFDAGLPQKNAEIQEDITTHITEDASLPSKPPGLNQSEKAESRSARPQKNRDIKRPTGLMSTDDPAENDPTVRTNGTALENPKTGTSRTARKSNQLWLAAGCGIAIAAIGIGIFFANQLKDNKTAMENPDSPVYSEKTAVTVQTPDITSSERIRSSEEQHSIQGIHSEISLQQDVSEQQSSISELEDDWQSTGAITPKDIESTSSGSEKASSSVILPTSSWEDLFESEVMNLNSYELCLARNEIYARHGYIFNSGELRRYFMAQDWYEPSIPSDRFTSNMLNDYERRNIALIQKVEDLKGEYTPN